MYMPRRKRPLRLRVGLPEASRLQAKLSCRTSSDRLVLRRMDIGQHRSASLDPLPQGHPDVRMAGQQNVYPGAELDQADPLPALHKIAYLKAEDDAPRQQSGDLFEAHIELIALHGHQILLVFFRRLGVERIQVLAFLIPNLAHRAGNGRAVDMNIEDAEEDTQADTLSSRRLDAGDLGDFAIRRRNHQACLDRHGTLGIAKEPEKKACQQNRERLPRSNCPVTSKTRTAAAINPKP